MVTWMMSNPVMSATILTLAAPQALFDQFWSAYPRKIGRKDALRAWQKLTPDQKEQAVKAIPAHVRYWDASETEKAFIPYPSSWLNGWRFDDELDEPAKKREDWTANDQTICAKAASLSISTHGKDRFTLIREIKERM